MSENRLDAVVGYVGGKRRMLGRLRPLYDVATMRRYVEPFVGMGALYLDLRARGYRGPALLADVHPQVAAFWRMVHDAKASKALRAACRKLDTGGLPAVADFDRIRSQPCDDAVERVARFLWLTNYGFGGIPGTYHPETRSWETHGQRLTSAAKWGKTYPWSAVVERLTRVTSALAGLPCEVHDDALPLLPTLAREDWCFADPPYVATRSHLRGETDSTHLIAAVLKTRARTVLTETRDLRKKLPRGWRLLDEHVLCDRLSQGSGATGNRREWLYSNF